MVDARGQVKAYSGQGHFLGNLVAFIFVFGLLLGGIFILALWELENAWLPGLIFLGLYTGAFLIAQEIIGTSDSLKQQDIHGEHGGGAEVPASSHH